MEQLIGLLVIGAIAFANWLMERYSKQRAERERAARPPAQRPQEPSVAPARGSETDEEKQIRKFFEALGLPNGESPVPPLTPPADRQRRSKRWEVKREISPSPAPTAEREATPQPQAREVPAPSRPGPPPKASQRRPVRPAPVPVRPRPASQPTPRPLIPPLEPDREPAMAESATRHLPIPVEAGAISAAMLEGRPEPLRSTIADTRSTAKEAYALHEKEASPDRNALRRRLKDVRAVREAYILREILGPPKALQE